MNKAYSMISLANKAGKLVSGEDAVRNSLRSGKLKLVLIAEDASDNTKKRFRNSADFYKTKFIIWGLKEKLGKSIGKSERSVIGITDISFSRNLLEMLPAEVKKNEIPGGGILEQSKNI